MKKQWITRWAFLFMVLVVSACQKAGEQLGPIPPSETNPNPTDPFQEITGDYEAVLDIMVMKQYPMKSGGNIEYFPSTKEIWLSMNASDTGLTMFITPKDGTTPDTLILDYNGTANDLSSFAGDNQDPTEPRNYLTTYNSLDGILNYTDTLTYWVPIDTIFTVTKGLALDLDS